MNERTLTPVQNAILNLVAETDYDSAGISEATKNETFADIVADYHTYNRIYKPMSIKERADWYGNASKDAYAKAQYWTERVALKIAEKHPKWKRNVEFWTKQAKIYEAEYNKLSRILDSQVMCNG